jgi:pyridoxine kinase
MLHTPYLETYTEEQIRDLLHDLGELGPRYVALTGISFAPDEIGVYAYDRATDEYHYYKNEKLPVAFHGTGDIYASLFLGALMRGHSVFESLDIAVDFTLLSMKKTLADVNYRTYGVNFEEVLGDYAKAL